MVGFPPGTDTKKIRVFASDDLPSDALMSSLTRFAIATAAVRLVLLAVSVHAADDSISARRVVFDFIQANCSDCHSGSDAEGGLDLDALGWDLSRREVFDRWVLIHDRVRDGEMPPPDGAAVPIADDDASESTVAARQALNLLATRLIDQDRQRIDARGRAKVRRLNRFEYENALRAALDAPWLRIADLLPEDGIEHLFNKSGERLDVSHVQLTRYMEAAQHSIRLALDAAAHPPQTRRFYAREEPVLQNYLFYRTGQTAATRSIVPLVDYESEPDVIRKLKSVTVGEEDPEKREREAMGVFSGVYSATTKYDFTRIDAPTDGRYRLRFKTYTFQAGPNGASGGNDQGLTGGKREWWRPDRNVTMKGTRSEPVTLYALAVSGDSRWLTTFDSHPEPSIFECVVSLRKGEGIRPDATRLVRTRPGWRGNPNATKEGVPGFAMNWLEVEGPLHDTWPPRSYAAILDDLPHHLTTNGHVEAISEQPEVDARRLLTRFIRAVRQDAAGQDSDVEPYVRVFRQAMELEQSFTDAMVHALAAFLCSPEFLYLETTPGALDDRALRERLAYFLWNGPPDATFDREAFHEAAESPRDDRKLKGLVDRMLDDPRSDHFVNSFLDYWLDLRDLNANTPDAALYTDYYLDEWLTESSLLETRRFFRELIEKDLPSHNLVDADFAFVNERLAEHYGLPPFEGVHLRRVDVPRDVPRGGLLTQSSVLRVTANGTTTSPVVRGAWLTERILGTDIPSPPSGVDAVEPDTRGAKTIREQLDKHRSIESCNACHAKFDPLGFALESFDVAGGWRERYRAVGEVGEPVVGIGKNGHKFQFKLAQPVDCSGTFANGESFADIHELERLLVQDERKLARNLLHQFIVYATGSPPSFADRGDVEAMLDEAAENQYGVRSLIHTLVRSRLFQRK